MKLAINPDEVKGFMPSEEGEALYELVNRLDVPGPCFEIGSYCGKSSVYIGSACRNQNRVLFTLDHHRGSEETQPGWEHHDPDTWDAASNAMDTLPFLRQTLHRAQLEDVVIPIVGQSRVVAQHWRTPLAFLFIDGGHGMEPALDDFRYWTPHIRPGGTLAIHDVFPDPKAGGRPPYEIYRLAMASGMYEETDAVGSLRALRRLT